MAQVYHIIPLNNITPLPITHASGLLRIVRRRAFFQLFLYDPRVSYVGHAYQVNSYITTSLLLSVIPRKIYLLYHTKLGHKQLRVYPVQPWWWPFINLHNITSGYKLVNEWRPPQQYVISPQLFKYSAHAQTTWALSRTTSVVIH